MDSTSFQSVPVCICTGREERHRLKTLRCTVTLSVLICSLHCITVLWYASGQEPDDVRRLILLCIHLVDDKTGQTMMTGI